jgi:predicted dinucleotide-binding enzyme
MKIAVLGTGMVGNTIATKLVRVGHEVCMGARKSGSEKATAWVSAAGGKASQGSFAEAASFAEVVFNCTAGGVSVEALRQAGEENLDGKVLIDLANPLDFSRGMPPRLTVCNDDSLGEQIQRAFPEVRVVKTLNTVNHLLMVDPALVPGEHHLFLCGNDAAAKSSVSGWLTQWFGWPPSSLIDLGDITAARGMEMFLPLWIRMMMTVGNPFFNVRVVRGAPPES